MFYVASYVIDNTPHIVDGNITQVMSTLEDAAASLFKWLQYVKGNPITEGSNEKILGIKFEKEIRFKVHPENFCKKPSQKNACTNNLPPIQGFVEKSY